MKMTAKADSDERFQSGANEYAVYLETPEGRLRSDLAFANLQDFLPLQGKPSLCALDLGCGTAATAVRLARLGFHVTLLDSSQAMLDIAQSAAREAGVTQNIALKHGDATHLANLFPAGSFDVILCHNILEYVDDPGAHAVAAAVSRHESGRQTRRRSAAERGRHHAFVAAAFGLRAPSPADLSRARPFRAAAGGLQQRVDQRLQVSHDVHASVGSGRQAKHYTAGSSRDGGWPGASPLQHR